MPRRNDLENRIIDHLGTLAYQISLRSTSNRQDLSVSCEKTFCGLLNLLMGWRLVDLNEEQLNFPGIDLADPAERVAVQITADNASAKVRETLRKFFGHHLDEKFRKLIVLVVKGKKTGVTEFLLEHDFQFSAREDIWDLEILKNKILAVNDTALLQKIAEYLDSELSSLHRLTPETMLLPPVPLLSESFVPGSREEELAQLIPKLDAGKPVFIWGLGGMGKTQTAIKLAERWGTPSKCWFLHYTLPMGEGSEAMRETILRADFTGYRYKGTDTEDRENEYRQRLALLKEDCDGALLVIDNFDWPGRSLDELKSEQSYRDLTALTRLGLRLVFTTRNPAERNACAIGSLSDGVLLTLMRTYYHRDDVTDDALLALIRAVNGHTLMTELMAKTLEKSWGRLTPADMLEALKQSGLRRREFRRVANDHNPDHPQAQIYAHMKALFDLSEMKPEEEAVLRWATLLPEDGMDAMLFEDCVPEENQDAVHDLVERGWLFRSEENLLTIHPVVREVCREELKPTDSNCRDFLDRLWNRYKRRQEFYADKYTQIGKCFSMASDKLADMEGEFALRAGWFWDKLGQPRAALRHEQRMVERREENPDTAPEALSVAYNNVGTTYGNLGDHKKALEYKLKALEIREKMSPPDRSMIAAYCNNAGTTYNALGDYEKALEYKLRALEIREELLPADHPALAHSYNSVGYTLYKMKEHGRALDYQLKAMGIRENVLPPDHPDLAMSYGNVGSTYGAMGDHTKALDYQLKALQIQEKVLPSEHPELASSYNNVGNIYIALGEHRQALEYHLKALAIREKVLPPEHPSLATSYHNVGSAHFYLKHHLQALEYLEKALAIYEKSLPAEHPYIAQVQKNMNAVRAHL